MESGEWREEIERLEMVKRFQKVEMSGAVAGIALTWISQNQEGHNHGEENCKSRTLPSVIRPHGR